MQLTFSLTEQGMVEFHHGGQSYLVGTHANAIAAAKAELPECLYRVSPEVFDRHLPPEAATLAVKILEQDGDNYAPVWSVIPDKTKFVEDAISSQGPAAFLSFPTPTTVPLSTLPAWLADLLVRALDFDGKGTPLLVFGRG